LVSRSAISPDNTTFRCRIIAGIDPKYPDWLALLLGVRLNPNFNALALAAFYQPPDHRDTANNTLHSQAYYWPAPGARSIPLQFFQVKMVPLKNAACWRLIGTVFLELLGFNPLIDLFSMYRHLFGCIDTDSDLIPLNTEYGHRHFITDHQCFTHPSCKY
jgi:hypothetical protein